MSWIRPSIRYVRAEISLGEDIKVKSEENEALDSSTQQFIKDIDDYVIGMGELQTEEENIKAKI